MICFFEVVIYYVPDYGLEQVPCLWPGLKHGLQLPAFSKPECKIHTLLACSTDPICKRCFGWGFITSPFLQSAVWMKDQLPWRTILHRELPWRPILHRMLPACYRFLIFIQSNFIVIFAAFSHPMTKGETPRLLSQPCLVPFLRWSFGPLFATLFLCLSFEYLDVQSLLFLRSFIDQLEASKTMSISFAVSNIVVCITSLCIVSLTACQCLFIAASTPTAALLQCSLHTFHFWPFP